MHRYTLPVIELTGSPTDMGRAFGSEYVEQTQHFVSHRLAITGNYLKDRGFAGEADLLAVGARGVAALQTFDPAGHAELVATAQAAGVEPEALFAAANYSDLRDVVLLSSQSSSAGPQPAPAIDPSAEGCTAFALAPQRTTAGAILAGQTWDLHPTDVDYVVAVRRRPDQGLRTVSVTTVASPTLIGLNEAGVYVGTTNIKVRGVRHSGVGYLNVLHAALSTARTAEHAADLMAAAPRLAAHTYWAADATTAVELETSATGVVRRTLAPEAPVLLQTNHCLDADHIALEAESPSDSSSHRLARATTLLDAQQHDVASIKAMMADRDGAPNCINRLHEDGQYAATNACAIAEPARGTLHACRGPADQGEWLELRP